MDAASDNKLRIAMFGHKRIPSREGGVEVVVEELASRMVEQGHSVVCYNRRGHNIAGAKYDSEKVRDYKGIHIKSVFTINIKGLAAVTSSISASIRAAFGQYDVVHIHAEGPAFMCWLPKMFGKEVVVTIHGLDWDRAKWGKFASWYIKTGEKNAVRYADSIIVLSQGAKEYFKREYGRETTFIPNGVNRPDIREAHLIKEKWGLEKDSYVLFLGRIVPEKGVHYLVEAFKEIQGKKLVIAGGASDTQSYFERLQETDKKTVFTGFQQGQVLEELYSNSYIYCLPSDLEGMPLSLLEALSYGNCCLVSDISECMEVVEDKAITFHKGDVDDLREKIEWLIANRNEVDKYKKEAAEYILDKFSWEDIVERTLAEYEGCE